MLIDDDAEVLAINCKYLKNEGYEPISATTAQKGLQLLEKFNPSCIILDIMMPGINGFDACKGFRKLTDIPIIFLTGKTSEEDKINGLMLGADDYIVKPYSLRELSARIHANIRRHQFTSTAAATLSYPPLIIDVTNHKPYYNDEEIALSNREYELLYLLASNPNKTITFEQIGKKMWGSYSSNDRRSIMVNASRLRKKLEGYIGLQNLIETVWSQGYKFVYHK